MSNVYYLLNKNAKHNLVIEKLRQLVSIIDIAKIDKPVVIAALNSKFKDFEDALQNFSAEQHPNIKTIITRNLKDYQFSSVAVLSPEMYLNKVFLHIKARAEDGSVGGERSL